METKTISREDLKETLSRIIREKNITTDKELCSSNEVQNAVVEYTVKKIRELTDDEHVRSYVYDFMEFNYNHSDEFLDECDLLSDTEEIVRVYTEDVIGDIYVVLTSLVDEFELRTEDDNDNCGCIDKLLETVNSTFSNELVYETLEEKFSNDFQVLSRIHGILNNNDDNYSNHYENYNCSDE